MAFEQDDEGAASAPSPFEHLILLPARIAGALSTALILAAFALVVYSVIQRYLLNTPLKWGDEMIGYLLVGLIMLGAAEALRRNDHIAIDLVSERLAGKPKRLLDYFSNLSVIAFSIVLGVSTWESILFAYDFGSYSPGYLEVATWIPQLPMLAGAFLLGLVALTRLLAGVFGKSR